MSQQEIFKAPIVANFEQLYRVYKVEKERAEPEYRIENVRFIHDPEWRERWFSVQNIGDTWREVAKAASSPLRYTWTGMENALFWTGFNLAQHRVTAP